MNNRFVTVIILFVAISLNIDSTFAQASTLNYSSRPLIDGEKSYPLGYGDVLRIIYYEESGLTDPGKAIEVTIEEDGTIYLPLLGTMEAAGKTPKELSTTILEEANNYVTVPVVRVEIAEYVSHNVTLLGAFRDQETFPLSHPMMLTDFIVTYGGFLPEANISNISVIRSDGTRIIVDLQSYYELGDTTQDVPLFSGDKVFAPVKGETFLVKLTRIAQIAVLALQVVTLTLILTR